MQNNTLQYKQPLYIALSIAVGILLGTQLQRSLQKNNNTTTKLNTVLSLVQANYVDAVNIDSLKNKLDSVITYNKDSVEDVLIATVLATLDPHSLIIPAKDLQQVNDEMKGAFAGVGVEYAIINDTLVISNVIPNGPAQKAALQIGDKVLQVNDSVVAHNGITSARIKKLFRGEPNTQLTLSIVRNKQHNKYKIIRNTVAITSIDAAYMLTAAIGYIRLNKFSFLSYEEFNEALRQLKGQGMQSLLFDLRGNGGGSLQDAVRIADEFLEANKTIVYTQGNHQPKQLYKSTTTGLFETGKLTLLIDEQSASASEILAGALQDWDRATIVGRRSFGKGLVQLQYNLPDHSALRLTTARYYTPLGRGIQKSYANGIANYYHDISERNKHHALTNADSNKYETGQLFTTPKGKKIYGGGGITPDYFVAVDTTIAYDTIFKQLYNTNTLNEFSLAYYIANTTAIKGYGTAAAYSQQFIITPLIWQQFSTYAATKHIKVNTLNTKQKEFIQKSIKQLLAKFAWQANGYYTVTNGKDEAILKAIALMQ